MNNKEKLYLVKAAAAGAAPGVWAGKGITGAEKGVGALSGVTEGLGATPIPVMDTKNLRRSSKELARYKELTSGLGGSVERNTKKLEGINKNLDRKVPGYMRTEHTGIPKRPLTVGPDSGYLNTADVLSRK